MPPRRTGLHNNALFISKGASPYEGHGDVPLHPVDPHPGGHEGQDGGHEVHEGGRGVALVAPRLPQFVQARPPDHQGGVQFHAVGPKKRVFEEFLQFSRNKM